MIKKNTHVLFYVDDDADDRFFFSDVVNAMGIKTVLFASADELLLSLRDPSPKPSIIFVDLNMPCKDGFATLKEIRKIDSYTSIPVVMFSTSGALQGIEECFRLGASLYLVKPTSIEALRGAVAQVLEMEWDGIERNRFNFVCRF
ncbi:MAG: response regulator [Flavobacterium sp.]|uniref:response regulator n=1 Tax=Flavobacterium sp. TaxID=239 RepID=UPI00121A1E63|nr:response regulator [Flavobacterium sp.]RZJ66313.1 MAG: response regulator [Flavobacterium sp.]